HCVLTAPATTLIYSLSLHDALPIFSNSIEADLITVSLEAAACQPLLHVEQRETDLTDLLTVAADPHPTECEFLTYFVAVVIAKKDRKSTRLNSSHVKISYAVFCLKK